MRGEKLIAAVAVAVVLLAGIYFAYALWFASNANSRESLLRALPPDATAVIYVDVAELRQGAILKNLAGLGASATVDPEYKQFVSETGFDYEKDLDRVGIAIQNAGGGESLFCTSGWKVRSQKNRSVFAEKRK